MAVATEREYGLFINGESTESSTGELRDLVEPATGEPLAKAAMAGEHDVERAVDAARAALDGDWARTPPTERSRLLQDRKSTRLNSSHVEISYAVFCLKKKKK